MEMPASELQEYNIPFKLVGNCLNFAPKIIVIFLRVIFEKLNRVKRTLKSPTGNILMNQTDD